MPKVLVVKARDATRGNHFWRFSRPETNHNREQKLSHAGALFCTVSDCLCVLQSAYNSNLHLYMCCQINELTIEFYICIVVLS